MRVFQAPLVPKFRTEKDGTQVPALCWKIGDDIYVHPDRWDEFFMWLNAPDVADHPEVRAWFRERDRIKP